MTEGYFNPQGYGMFSAAGDERVAALVEQAKALPITASTADITTLLTEGMNRIEAEGHGEVWDTAVREVVIGRLERATHRTLSIFF